MRWLVGDVQGCAREFEDLLGRIRFDSGRDELWCLGDLVNRGPDSAAALRLWRDASGHCVLGNHDVYALLAHSGRIARREDTLEDLFSCNDADTLLARLRGQPAFARVPAGQHHREVWMVHAGLSPQWGLDADELTSKLSASTQDDDWLQSEDVAFATRVRCCDAQGIRSSHSDAPESCPAPFRPWDDFYAGPALVVHGHWAARGYYRTERTLGLDTGCVWGGMLTAWCLEEDRIVQVPSRIQGLSRSVIDLGAAKPQRRP